MRTRIVDTPPLAGLTPAQADGLACVWCAAAYTAVEAAHVPVGRSESGSQVFACNTWCERLVWVWRLIERTWPDHKLVSGGFAAFRDYYELVLRETRARLGVDQSSSD